MAGLNQLNPFTPEHIALAHKVVESADMALDLYRKCEDCKASMKAMADQVQAQREFAAGIIRNFGSAAPTV